MTTTTASASGSTSRIAIIWWTQLTTLALVIMELCWLVPWFRTVIEVSYVASVEVTVLVMAGVMLVAYWTTRLLESLRLLAGIQRLVMIGAFVVVLIGGGQLLLNRPLFRVVNGLADLDPGAVLVVMAFLWLWWRGSSLGRDLIRPVVVWRRFILGLLMFLAHVFMVTRLRSLVLQDAPGLPLFTFFLVTSLLAMVLSRITFVSLAYGVRKNPFDRRWLGSTAFTVAAIVGLALVLGTALSGQYSVLLDHAAEGVRWFFLAVMFVASLPWLLLSYVIGPIFPFLRQFIPEPTTTPTPIVDPYAAPASGRLPQVEVAPITDTTQMFVFWGVILLLILTLFLARRQSASRGREDLDDAESLLRKGDGLRLLRKALRDRLNAASGVLNRWRMGRRIWAAARIRRLYAQLLDLCAELKRPRPEYLTPNEFLPVMGELFPGYIESLRRITEAYVAVRYGELPESMEEVEALEEAFKQIHSVGQQLKKARLADLQVANVDEVRRTVV